MSKWNVLVASLMVVMANHTIPAMAQPTLGDALQSAAPNQNYQSQMLEGSASTYGAGTPQNTSANFDLGVPAQDGKFTGYNPPLGALAQPPQVTNAQDAMYPQAMNGMQNGMVAQNNMNNFANGAQCNMASQSCAAMNNAAPPNCCQQGAQSACCNTPVQNGNCGQMPGCGNNMNGAQTGYNNGNNAGLNLGNNQFASRAVGIAGTMMMLQMFNNNGGIGGMMRSVGWGDTRFHGRGPSIGGY